MLDPSVYPPTVADLLRSLPLAPLGPGTPDVSRRPMIEAACAVLPAACQSGLWLAFNYLDESHEISQGLHTPEGSFWHAIMHRREPDAFNSKYWWRRVGDHPVFAQLHDEATKLDWQAWDPMKFVDECERHRDTGTDMEILLRRVQHSEWEHLFAWCYTHSVADR